MVLQRLGEFNEDGDSASSTTATLTEIIVVNGTMKDNISFKLPTFK